MRYLVSGPAWIASAGFLGGLNGAADWGGGDANVLAPEFAAVMPPDAFTQRAGIGGGLRARHGDRLSWYACHAATCWGVASTGMPLRIVEARYQRNSYTGVPPESRTIVPSALRTGFHILDTLRGLPAFCQAADAILPRSTASSYSGPERSRICVCSSAWRSIPQVMHCWRGAHGRQFVSFPQI